MSNERFSALDAKIRAIQSERAKQKKTNLKQKATLSTRTIQRQAAVDTFYRALNAFQDLGYTFGPKASPLEWHFHQSDYAIATAPLAWFDESHHTKRHGHALREKVEIVIAASAKPGEKFIRGIDAPTGVLFTGTIQEHSHVTLSVSLDSSPGDVFAPVVTFQHFLSQAELAIPPAELEQSTQDILVAMLDTLAPAINTPDYIKTLD